MLEAKGQHDPCVVLSQCPSWRHGGADDHRLTLSAAGAVDSEELIAAAQENRPPGADGDGG